MNIHDINIDETDIAHDCPLQYQNRKYYSHFQPPGLREFHSLNLNKADYFVNPNIVSI